MQRLPRETIFAVDFAVVTPNRLPCRNPENPLKRQHKRVR